MNTKIIVSVIISLAIGFGIGALVFRQSNTPKGMHRMADGTLMHNTMSGMENMMHDMNASLKGKTGNAFDAEFLAQMIVHHQGAIDMAEQAFIATERPEILLLANEIIAAQQKEIEQMKAWQTEWFR